MMENRYLFANRALMDMFHTHKAELEGIIPRDQRVDFIFDRQTERKEIDATWDRYMENRPLGLEARYGEQPRFEDDREFLPLQAADLWAWWVRKWHRDGTLENIRRDELDFGMWKGQRRPFPRWHIEMSRDNILENVVKMIGEMWPGSTVIINRTDYEAAWREAGQTS